MKLVHKSTKELRTPARPIREFSTEAIKELKERMLEVMKEKRGIGIAAPQIGEYVAAAIVKLDGKNVMILNPQVIATNDWYISREGCLSLPGGLYAVPRPSEIKITYQTEYGDFAERTVKDKMEATIIHHEISHLQGLLIDDVSRVEDPLASYKANRPELEFEDLRVYQDFKQQLSLLPLLNKDRK